MTEGEEVDRKEQLKTRWAQLEALVGSEHRLGLVARDLVAHFEDRLSVMEGKAMVVAMSRRIAVDLYHEIATLRPEWVGEGDGARLFACGDATGVARAVEAVLDDPAWAERARARNRAVVGARADWTRNMAEIEALLARLASGARTGGRA